MKPITDVLSNDVACNGGPNPTMSSDKVINVKAGETVKATWRHTLTSALLSLIVLRDTDYYVRHRSRCN